MGNQWLNENGNSQQSRINTLGEISSIKKKKQQNVLQSKLYKKQKKFKRKMKNGDNKELRKLNRIRTLVLFQNLVERTVHQNGKNEFHCSVQLLAGVCCQNDE